MTKEQIKQTAGKELVAYLKGCAFSLCPASQKYMAEHIEEILKASETTKELEKENAELKEQNANLLEGKVEDWTSEYYELENFMNNKLSEAKKIVKHLLPSCRNYPDNNLEWIKKAEEFLKEM